MRPQVERGAHGAAIVARRAINHSAKHAKLALFWSKNTEFEHHYAQEVTTTMPSARAGLISSLPRSWPASALQGAWIVLRHQLAELRSAGRIMHVIYAPKNPIDLGFPMCVSLADRVESRVNRIPLRPAPH
jgi:hypothetical protein